MKKKKMIKTAGLLLLCLLISACGKMIADEPFTPMPKKEDLRSTKQKQADNKAQTPVQETKKTPEQTPPDESLSSDPNLALADIETLLAGMSLEQKVGQMFLARCPETGAAESLKKYHLGGYLLFGRDFKDKSKEEVIAVIASYQKAAAVPLWIAVDEEGGVVNRVSRNPALRLTPFASPQFLYQNGGWDRIKNDTAEKAELLKSLGINLNMAPVCDIPEKETDFIYDRAVSTDPQVVQEYAGRVVAVMNEGKMGSVLKHFPGYGNNIDTHTEFAYDQRPLETFKTRDFLPFLAGIKNGAGAVLVSHNVMTAVDDRMPASLSAPVHQLLRKDLAFKGVVITDDLMMDAVKKLMTEEEAAILAVLAGNDMLCATSFEVQVPAVIEAVRSGRIPSAQIDASVRRILLWKQSFLKAQD
ncbi:beta-hexosaminidase [Lachnospiraceae bacterium oral taxon 500]|nr:beta-hexosaminidase [Lachnospiraceae bacterium oral taxon 500]